MIPEKPNIVYLHSHDTGLYIQPWTELRTHALQAFTEKSVMFRQTFSAAPNCSTGMAALLTGEIPPVSEEGLSGYLPETIQKENP